MSILNERQMNQVVTRIATDLKQGDPRYYLGYLGGSIDVVDGVLFEVHLGARPNLSLPVCSPSTCFACFFLESSPTYVSSCMADWNKSRNGWRASQKMSLTLSVHSSFCDADKSTESCSANESPPRSFRCRIQSSYRSEPNSNGVLTCSKHNSANICRSVYFLLLCALLKNR